MKMLCIVVSCLLVASCGKDNFGVSINGCENPVTELTKHNCSSFKHKPWFYGLDEESGFFVFKNGAQPYSKHLLRTLTEAKNNKKYVSIGGETPDLVLHAILETYDQWKISGGDISGLIVQVHSSNTIREPVLTMLGSMGVKAEFYEI